MRYKNTSNQTQELIGFGVLEPNEVIGTDREINNPNFKEEEVKETSPEPTLKRRPRGRVRTNG